MELENELRSVIKSLFTIILALIMMIAYIYVSSALAHKNYKGITADMYGLSTLYYEGDPVMSIYVWQGVVDGNENSETRKIIGYEMEKVKLIPGETVINLEDPFLKPTKALGDAGDFKMTVVYDGEMRGEYEYDAEGEVKYTSVADPDIKLLYDATKLVHPDTMETRDDGTFAGNGMMSLSINAHLSPMKFADSRKENYLPELQYRVQGIEMRDSIHREYLKTIYPDAPFIFRELYRDVMSTKLTIYAIDPTDNDSVKATAELVIRQLSEWRNVDNVTRSLMEKLEFYPTGYSEILVVSYTQSDMFQ